MCWRTSLLLPLLVAVAVAGEAAHHKPVGVAQFSKKQIQMDLPPNPTEAVKLMSPKMDDNKGNLNLVYPVETPEGRNGVQPNLMLTYNNGVEQSSMGTGWELAGVPHITVDTTWGAPRYSASLETETYTFHGQQLTPVAFTKVQLPRKDERVFHLRSESGFMRIVRHGSSPASYWWEVTEKSGVRHFYGGTPEAGKLAAASLSTARGEGFLWSVVEVRDLHGNAMKYTHAKTSGNLQELYPVAIAYTSSPSVPAMYTVDLSYDSTSRVNTPVECRRGSCTVQKQLLQGIRVQYKGKQIRRYAVSYTTGPFEVSLAETITKFDKDDKAFETHKMRYLDDIGTAYVGPGEEWHVGSDGVSGNGYDASAIGGVKTHNSGEHLYLGFNLEMPSKFFSFGFKVGSGQGGSETMLELIDIDGDLLPDKVFQKGSSVFYRRNLGAPDGEHAFGPVVAVPTLSEFFKSQNSFTSLGAEEYLGINVFENWSQQRTIQDVYWKDVNGDGFVDVVQNGGVLFNCPQKSGAPKFGTTANCTPFPPGPAAADADDVYEQLLKQYEDSLKNATRVDTILRWRAEYDGSVRVSGNITASSVVDDIRVAIQDDAKELWVGDLTAERTTLVPAGVDTIPVKKGDRLYFRVGSKAGAGGVVAWDPVVEYTSFPAMQGPNGRTLNHFELTEDFALAGWPGAAMTLWEGGNVSVSGVLSKPKTSDDVSVQVLRNDVITFERNLPAAFTGDFAVAYSFMGSVNDTLRIRVHSDSPVDVAKIAFAPSIKIANSTSHGDEPAFLGPVDVVMYPLSDSAAPPKAYMPAGTGLTNIDIAVVAAAGADGTVVFTLKTPVQLLAKEVFTVKNGVVTGNTQVSVKMTQGVPYFASFSSPQTDAPKLFTSLSARTVSHPLATPLYYAEPMGLFPPSFRGWAYAGYNAEEGRATQPIDESRLRLPTKEEIKSGVMPAYMFIASAGEWKGPTSASWVSPGKVSSGRMGSLPALPPREGFSGGMAVSVVSKGSQASIGAGAFFFSGSVAKGSTYCILDFMDMNGDSFPDVVKTGAIQYSPPWGGLDASSSASFSGKVRNAESTVTNFGVGGDPAHFLANAFGHHTPGGHHSSGSHGGNSHSQLPSLGLSGSLTESSSHVTEGFADINGDGLQDRCTADGSSCTLSTGYRFEVPFSGGSLSEGSGKGTDIGASIGWSDMLFGFSGGMHESNSQAKTEKSLMDMNGDKRLDRIYVSGSSLMVEFNMGTTFLPAVVWGTLSSISEREDVKGDVGGYITISIPVYIGYIIINPGANGGKGAGRTIAQLMDVDGDGNIDIVESHNDGELKVALNRVGRSNLLESVDRPLGSALAVEWARKGNTIAMPHSVWVPTSVEIIDNWAGDGADSQMTVYGWADPYYDRGERAFYGFGTVLQSAVDPTDASIYRTITKKYNVNNYYEHGLLVNSTLVEGAAGRVFDVNVYKYDPREVPLQPGDQETVKTVFVALITHTTFEHEGQAGQAVEHTATFDYDNYGNTILEVDHGEAAKVDDLAISTKFSHSNAECVRSYVVDVPLEVMKTDGTGALLRHSLHKVDCSAGETTQTTLMNGNVAAVTDLDHYDNGNLKSVTGPLNHKGQRYALAYQYEADGLAISKITDSWGYTSTQAWDLMFHRKTRITDANLNTITKTYDAVGRVISVTGPVGPSPLISYSYSFAPNVALAIARHYDVDHPGTTVDMARFTDPLGRTIQTKHTASIWDASANKSADVMVVSGRVLYDFVGKKVTLYEPITEPLGTIGTFNNKLSQVPATTYKYDIEGRITNIRYSDGSTTATSHGIGMLAGSPVFHVVETDQNSIDTQHFYNNRHLQVKTVLAGNVESTYSYNALKQVVKSTDDQGYLTTLAYDMMGRRTDLHNANAGLRRNTYDPAGNVIERTSSRLMALKAGPIKMTFDYNRLVSVTYPLHSNQNVTYSFGQPGAPNNTAGRMKEVTDGSGTQKLTYDAMGEVTSSVRTVATWNGSPPPTYTTAFTLDAYGRQLTVLYPDGELVTNRYDAGGKIRAVYGVKGPYRYDYAKRFVRTMYSQVGYIQEGNDMETTWSYDKITKRMSNILTVYKGETPLQNLHYGWDPAGWLQRLENAVPVPVKASPFGPTTFNYTRDDLYRMIHAEGTFQNDPRTVQQFHSTMKYDTIHRILRKQQQDEVIKNGGKPQIQKKTTYDFDYHYATNGSLPHTPVHIGNRSHYNDENGNRLGWDDDLSGQHVRKFYDEEDRVLDYQIQGNHNQNMYNHAGARVSFRNQEGTRFDVNRYWSVKNGVVVKHFFAGELRLTSKVVQATSYESKQYFFHHDHLRSTHFVTDKDHVLSDHLEYFPFGETWVRDGSRSWTSPYLFTNHEFDETGLYYFGRRFYDPQESLWSSSDPMLEQFTAGHLNGGGIYKQQNMNMYAYCVQAPHIHYDAHGGFSQSFKESASSAVKSTAKTIGRANEAAEGAKGKYLGGLGVSGEGGDWKTVGGSFFDVVGGTAHLYYNSKTGAVRVKVGAGVGAAAKGDAGSVAEAPHLGWSADGSAGLKVAGVKVGVGFDGKTVSADTGLVGAKVHLGHHVTGSVEPLPAVKGIYDYGKAAIQSKEGPGSYLMHKPPDVGAGGGGDVEATYTFGFNAKSIVDGYHYTADHAESAYHASKNWVDSHL